MRRLNSILLIAVVFAFSCTVQKRVYRPGFHLEWVSKHHNKANPHHKTDKKILPEAPVFVSRVHPAEPTSPLLSTSAATLIPEHLLNFSPRSVINIRQDCDELMLKDGTEIKAKVLEVGIDVIRYKKCDDLNGQVYFVKKDQVFMIKYASGAKEVFKPAARVASPTPVPATGYTKPQKMQPLVILGFIVSLIGILVATYILSPIAILFAYAGLKKIAREPDIYKGKGLGTAAIIIAVLAIIITTILLLSM